MPRIFLFSLLLILSSTNPAQSPLPSSLILHQLEKLGTCGTVLYIAAHPDDENTRLLSYLANEKKLRTGYLSLTRGDGGQNLIGKEQAEALGVLRTQELLAARKIDGAEQFFTRANDFGYSKTAEETLRIWNRDSILADMVYILRHFRPDVVICRFPATGEGGHGHHTASAILALEAVDAAANPQKFPAQLLDAGTWQVKRVFWNTFNFSSRNTTSPDQLKIDVGGYNPLLGKSYGEIAAESRSMHKSQGFGTVKLRGSIIEYFKLLKGDSARQHLMEGINTSWTRFGKGAAIQKSIDALVNNFDPRQPDKSLESLKRLYRTLQQTNPGDSEFNHWKALKLNETGELLLACAGLWLEANSDHPVAIPGQAFRLSAQVLSRTNAALRLEKISFGDSDSLTELSLQKNTNYTFRHSQHLPAAMPYSHPYWLNEAHSEGLYALPHRSLTGRPENPPALRVTFHLRIEGLPLTVHRTVAYKSADPVKGEFYRPLEVLPPVSLELSEKVQLFKGAEKKVMLTIRSNASGLSGSLKVKATGGWSATIAEPDMTVEGMNTEIRTWITVSPGTSPTGQLEVYYESEGGTYHHGIRRIAYDHMPNQFILTKAVATLINADIKTAGQRIGYIPGAGDEIPAALQQMGYRVDLLPDQILATADLSVYDAIVTGIRAYNTNNDLRLYQEKLLNYVNRGGNLLVQYNTNSHVGPLQGKIGPYPFTISRERVTDELAEVEFAAGDHPALNVPNKISAADFSGWIQERGIYFATAVDSHYTPILKMHDPGEKPNTGSLIVAPYGKGNFVYTGLSFFRQLPAGVPGAYKLFANLLSLPENP